MEKYMFSPIIERLRSICMESLPFINSKHGPSVHIAAFFKGKRLVNHSMNDYDRQCINGRKTTSQHAEVGCTKCYGSTIKKGLWLLVLRFNRQGHLKESRPCSSCKKFLINKGISSIYCSVEDGSIEKIRLSEVIDYVSPSQLKFNGGYRSNKEPYRREPSIMKIQIHIQTKLQTHTIKDVKELVKVI